VQVSCKTWNLESWNPGILESWNLIIYITAKYVIIKIILFSTYATYCSACDNLIFGELAEADLGNILSVYTIYVAEFNISILMPIHNNINAVRASK
jgi:hypothetical protein